MIKINDNKSYSINKINDEICIITSPFLLKAGIAPLKNLISIITSISNNVIVISGFHEELKKNSAIRYYFSNNIGYCSNNKKIIRFLLANIKIISRMISNKNVKNYIFFFRGGVYDNSNYFFKIIGKKNNLYFSRVSEEKE